VTRDIAIDVVEAVADAENVEPSDLDIAIGEYVDLDALSQLARHSGSAWTVTFDLPAHEVTVIDDGTVLVEESTGRESLRA